MSFRNQKSRLAKRRASPQSLEALAFYLGAHGIDPATVATEIEAGFEADAAEEKQEVMDQLRTLEGNLEDVRRRLSEAESVWNRVRAEIGDTEPPRAEAIAMAVFAAFSLGLDTVFITPGMDLMNVTDEALQFVAAAGLAVLATLYFHMCGSVLVSPKATRLMKLAAGAVGGCGIIALAVWGLVRGYQIGFSAMLAQNPLGQFLSEHPILSAIFYTFVTVTTPLVGAAASVHAWRSIRTAHEWRRAHNTWERLSKREVQLAKDITKATDRLAHLDALANTNLRQWNAILAQYYERGRSHGSRQETMVSVIRKSTLATLAATPVFLLAELVPIAILTACPVVVGVGVFAWLSHRRVHPGHDRYLKQENTQFAVPDGGFVQVRPQTPVWRLSKGDD
jgi:hypothetical protein